MSSKQCQHLYQLVPIYASLYDDLNYFRMQKSDTREWLRNTLKPPSRSLRTLSNKHLSDFVSLVWSSPCFTPVSLKKGVLDHIIGHLQNWVKNYSILLTWFCSTVLNPTVSNVCIVYRGPLVSKTTNISSHC